MRCAHGCGPDEREFVRCRRPVDWRPPGTCSAHPREPSTPLDRPSETPPTLTWHSISKALVQPIFRATPDVKDCFELHNTCGCMAAGQSPWAQSLATVQAERRPCLWRTAALRGDICFLQRYKWSLSKPVRNCIWSLCPTVIAVTTCLTVTHQYVSCIIKLYFLHWLPLRKMVSASLSSIFYGNAL